MSAYPTSWRCTAFFSHFPSPSFNPSIISTRAFMFFSAKSSTCSLPVLQPWCCFGAGLLESQSNQPRPGEGCSRAPIATVNSTHRGTERRLSAATVVQTLTNSSCAQQEQCKCLCWSYLCARTQAECVG